MAAGFCRFSCAVEQAVRLNNIIPVNLMRLSTQGHSGIWDPWGGLNDLKAGSYRFIRNGFYKESPLYTEGQDLELFSALLYLQVVLEARLPIDALGIQPGWKTAQDVFAEASTDRTVMIALQESAYLRSRLLYLFKSALSAAGSPSIFRNVLTQSTFDAFRVALFYYHHDLGNIISSLYSPPPATFAVGSAYTTTGRLGGDTFRLPHGTLSWSSADAGPRFSTILSISPGFEEITVKNALGAEQSVVLRSPMIRVNEGRTPSASPRARTALRPALSARRPAMTNIVLRSLRPQ